MYVEAETRMNVQIAKDAYSKVKKETSSQDKTNHANVGMALRQLQSNMLHMTQAVEHDGFKKSYRKALYSVYFLQQSLDFDKGGELANNLWRLYEFCRLTIEKTVISGQPENSKLSDCCKYIGDIVESWEKIYS